MEKHLQYPGLCFPVHPSDRTGVHSNPDVVSLPSQSLLSSRSDPELTKIPSFPRDLQEGGRAPAAPGVPDHGASGDLCQQVQERQMGSGWTRECTKSTQKCRLCSQKSHKGALISPWEAGAGAPTQRGQESGKCSHLDLAVLESGVLPAGENSRAKFHGRVAWDGLCPSRGCHSPNFPFPGAEG